MAQFGITTAEPGTKPMKKILAVILLVLAGIISSPAPLYYNYFTTNANPVTGGLATNIFVGRSGVPSVTTNVAGSIYTVNLAITNSTGNAGTVVGGLGSIGVGTNSPAWAGGREIYVATNGNNSTSLNGAASREVEGDAGRNQSKVVCGPGDYLSSAQAHSACRQIESNAGVRASSDYQSVIGSTITKQHSDNVASVSNVSIDNETVAVPRKREPPAAAAGVTAPPITTPPVVLRF